MSPVAVMANRVQGAYSLRTVRRALNDLNRILDFVV